MPLCFNLFTIDLSLKAGNVLDHKPYCLHCFRIVIRILWSLWDGDKLQLAQSDFLAATFSKQTNLFLQIVKLVLTCAWVRANLYRPACQNVKLVD